MDLWFVFSYLISEIFKIFTIFIQLNKGAKRLSKNVELMTGKKTIKFITICWYFVSPVFILIIWIFNWIQYTPVTYGKYNYSTGAVLFGWSIAFISIVSIPLGAVHTLMNSSEKRFIDVSFNNNIV